MVRQKTDQERDGEGEQDMEEKDESRETGHPRQCQEKSKRASEVGSGPGNAGGRRVRCTRGRTQEKERSKNMEPQGKAMDDYKPSKRWPAPKNVCTGSLLVEPPASRVLNRGISIRQEIIGHLRRATEVEETASLTSHGRASGRVRRHDRHLVPGCKPRHDPLRNNAHSGPTTQSTLRRQPASRGSGEPPNKPPTLEMPREATQQQRTRRAEEPKENKHHREPPDENLDIKIWKQIREGQINCQ